MNKNNSMNELLKFKQIENINLNIKMEEKNNNNTENNNESKKSEVGNYAFKFPLENSFSKVEIPFAFQSNIDENSNSNKFHSYIKIQETPTLYLDISNDEKVDKLFLSSTIENLKSDNQQKEKQISSLETSITETKAENESIKAEIARLHEEIMLRSGKIKTLTQTIKENEEIHNKQINEMSLKVNEKTKMLKGLKENYEKIKNELKKNSNSLTDSLLDSAHEQLQKLTIEYVNTPDFFSNKFTCESYNDEYIQKSLQLDLLDFQAYVKEQIIKVKPKLNELIDLIQKAVDDSIGSNYIVKLYGSHATNLCLPWSDLDVVIVNKEKDFVNSYVPLHELFKYLQEKNYFLTINFIGTATVPLIKIHTKENYGLMSVDISLQDNKHYGIQCVTLVTSLIEKYDVLTPMVLALKNILKKANLNDPYKGGLSSYGLILLIVFFLKKQIESGKPIKKEDGNLGRLFYEFLYFYGIQFDPSKHVVNVSDLQSQKKLYEQSSYFPQSDLIIVDPLNAENNVGKNTRQFNNIKLAFMIGFIASKEECECGCHYQFHNSVQCRDIEHCILKRIFNAVKRFTPDSL